MTDRDSYLQRIQEACSLAIPGAGQNALLESLHNAAPELQFQVNLSRGGWHRMGGVVKPEGSRVADHLDVWLEQETPDGVTDLLAKYADAGYLVTRLNGCTHYLVAQLGESPWEYLQLEVEELQEVVERPLIEPDFQPDDIEEVLDPEGYTSLDATPVGGPRYLCRRLTHIGDFVARMAKESETTHPMQRFFRDWQSSSAGEAERFCDHWVLNLREYTDPYGEPVMQARPLPVFDGELPELNPDVTTRGSALANYIHDFDRLVGYHTAWYFYMLCRKKVSPRVAEAIHNDLQGAYDYLPPRDLQILNAWMASPYAV